MTDRSVMRAWLVALFVLCVGCAPDEGEGESAEQAEAQSSDSQEVDRLPDAQDLAQQVVPTPGVPTLWLAGDSTVQTYKADQAPMEGWGQRIGEFFDRTLTVNNQALGGRSTRTFMFNNVACVNGRVTYTGGKPDEKGTRWERIKQNIRAGDFLMIQFGHNDNGTVCERHVDLPEFKKNLATMVAMARGKSATPILITPMSQLKNENGQLKATLGNYAAAVKEVAVAEKVEVVDLNALSIAYYRKLGVNGAKQLFMPNETTHFVKKGAVELSRLITDDLRRQALPIATHLKKEVAAR
ncbi:MAG: rhamnogalacturonan acetylesterase [Polyangiales bacterium]